MQETLIEKIRLDNQAILEIHDASRTMIGDRLMVVLTARVRIFLDYIYQNSPSPDLPPRKELESLLGDPVVWEHSRHRRFIDKKEKDAAFQSLRADFDANLRPYLTHPDFPSKYVIKQLENRQNPSGGRRA